MIKHGLREHAIGVRLGLGEGALAVGEAHRESFDRFRVRIGSPNNGLGMLPDGRRGRDLAPVVSPFLFLAHRTRAAPFWPIDNRAQAFARVEELFGDRSQQLVHVRDRRPELERPHGEAEGFIRPTGRRQVSAADQDEADPHGQIVRTWRVAHAGPSTP